MRTFTISEALLDELKDYFENRQDVCDGSYGEPVANEEMFLLMRLEEDCRPLPDAAPRVSPQGESTTADREPAAAALPAATEQR
jgi:hypothetical protein